MKLVYIANVRFPTEKAHGVQIAKTCEAFERQGVTVSLVVPTRHNTIREDAFTYYGITKTFEITRLRIWDTVAWGRLGFIAATVQFAVRAAWWVVRADAHAIYGRDHVVMWFVSLFSPVPIVWESHTGAWNFFAKQVAMRAQKIIVISHGLKEFYIARGVPVEKILVAHDGVDLQTFAEAESKESARRRLNIPTDKKVALYIGRVDGWKGVVTLCEASRLVPEALVVVIGGEEHQVTALKREYEHILFLGFRPYREIANNLSAADLLILPNTGTQEVSTHFTSPLKLFAYMASGRPIVASDLPSVREILDNQSAFLVPADDPRALAHGIRDALREGEAKAARAREKVVDYDWQNRALRIIACLKR